MVTLTVAALLMAAAGTTYAVLRPDRPVDLTFPLRSAPPPCRLDLGDASLGWNRERAMSATTVAAVGQRIGVSRRAVAAAVARTLGGKADHVVGVAAARRIYRSLPDRVRPAAHSRDVAASLLGRQGAALTCRVEMSAIPLPEQRLTGSGLTPRAEALRAEMRKVFGEQPLGGFEAGGVRSGHIEGSAHYEGRAIDVFFRPVTAVNQQRGWLQAQWAVAHAGDLQLATVIFDRRVWTAERSSLGWRDYRYPDGPTANPVLLHEDHVHLDVQEGAPRGHHV